MKNGILFLLTLCTLFASCDGEDSKTLDNNTCYALIDIVGVSGNVNENATCEVTFLFIDDQGNEYEQEITVPDDNENSIIVALPKNRCYGAWVLDVGDGTCGTYEFEIATPSNPYAPAIEAPGGGIYEVPPCFTFSEFVDDRLDVYGEDEPEYTFCLDDDCSCPSFNL